MASKDENVVESISPAAKYKQLLLETGDGPGPSEDKMILVFKVLDQIIPHLGVFVEVMKMCRDELFEAVYSDQYTGSDEDKKKKRYIQRLPFFTLVKRVYSERDEVNDKLKDQMEMVKEKLFAKQVQFEEACEKIQDLEQHVTNMKQMIDDLEGDLTKKNEDYDSLQTTLDEVKEAAEKTEYQLNCDIAELQEDLQEARTEAAYLTQFKSGYDDLQDAFGNMIDFEINPRRKSLASIATKRAHIIASIEHANKLESQILTVQNSTIEDYDRFLEQHKSALIEQEADEHDINQLEVDSADQELMLQQNRFEKTVDDMNLELDLLRQQRNAMMEQLQALEETKPKQKSKRKKSKQLSRVESQETGISEDMAVDETTQVDPFALQERIFSRYAAMIYASDNNGKTFHEFKAAEYCKCCGEKTVLCPHKLLKSEHVFPLPHNATHIKVKRPNVRVNTGVIEEVLREERGGDDSSGARLPVPSSKSMRSRFSISAQMSPLSAGSEGSEGGRLSGYGEGDIDAAHFIHSVDRLWDDFKVRTDLTRMVPRALSMHSLTLLIEDFTGTVFARDADKLNPDMTNWLDSLYQYMSERYLKEDIMYFATHDLISAIVKYAPTNKTIWLFAQTLIGNLDAAVFRYILLLGDFINLVQWKEMDDFKAFAEVIYPFLNEDDLDSFQMNYTSYSENMISKTLVAEFIVYNIMKYREPRFIECENKLLNVHHSDNTFMTEMEYVDASDEVLGVVNDKLRRRLYHEAYNFVKTKDGMAEGVPIARLAQITAYLSLVEVSALIKSNLVTRVEEARLRRQDDSTTGKPAHMRMNHEVAPTYELLTWSAAQKLANNIAKQKMARKRSNSKY